MAVTGIIFALFVLAHMYGNLKALAGEEAFNTYAEHLRTIGQPMLPYAGLLWILRIVLLVSVVIHVYAALVLWSRSNAARPTKYAKVKTVLVSQTMRWGGIALLLFIIWHLIQFTIGKVNVNGAVQVETHNPYQLLVASFQVPWMTAIYVLAMIALALHLSHGVFSAQQTLGWTMDLKARARAKAIAHTTSALIVVGFLIPPLAIQFGLVK